MNGLYKFGSRCSLDEKMSNFLAYNLSIFENSDALLIYLKYTHAKNSGWNLDAVKKKHRRLKTNKTQICPVLGYHTFLSVGRSTLQHLQFRIRKSAWWRCSVSQCPINNSSCWQLQNLHILFTNGLNITWRWR